MDSRSDFLNELPKDVITIITDYVDPVSMIHLDLTACRYHMFFNQDIIIKRKLQDSRQLINIFFTLVVFALLKVPDKNNHNTMLPALENMLELCPQLLTYRHTVKDHAGRTLVNRTGYQIALAYAADNIYPMMEKYFIRLPNGKEEMKSQFKEQFPDGVIKAYPKYDIKKAREALHQAKKCLQEDTCISYQNGEDFHFLEVMNESTRNAINEFFAIITSHQEHTIGLVNDMYLYHESINIYYNQEFNRFTNWAQRDVYCVFILGGLQALFTPNILQVLLQGANQVIDQAYPLAYVTKTRFRGTDISPFDVCPRFRLGKHFVLDYYSGQRSGRPYFIAPFEPFCRAKITRLEQLMQQFYPKEEVVEDVKWCCTFL